MATNTPDNTLHVTVVRNRYGSCFAKADDGTTLFQFEHRKAKDSPDSKAAWLCWLFGQYNPNIFHKKAFPRPFFDQACSAVAFIRCRLSAIPAAVVIDSGESPLSEKPKN